MACFAFVVAVAASHCLPPTRETAGWCVFPVVNDGYTCLGLFVGCDARIVPTRTYAHTRTRTINWHHSQDGTYVRHRHSCANILTHTHTHGLALPRRVVCFLKHTNSHDSLAGHNRNAARVLRAGRRVPDILRHLAQGVHPVPPADGHLHAGEGVSEGRSVHMALHQLPERYFHQLCQVRDARGCGQSMLCFSRKITKISASRRLRDLRSDNCSVLHPRSMRGPMLSGLRSSCFHAPSGMDELSFNKPFLFHFSPGLAKDAPKSIAIILLVAVRRRSTKTFISNF